jgi:hypothetical protein
MKKAMCIIAAIVFALIPLIPWAISINASITFSANCKDYLKLAADANSIELAEKHLASAISYLEKEGLTTGHTKIIHYYPSNDIGLWYENLKSAQTQLRDIQSREYTELEESNMLMKLRETILDSDNSVTHPIGISMADNFSTMFWLNILIWLPCWAIAIFFGIISEDY